MSGSTPEARVVRARIVTVSTRASAGVYDDTAGPAVEAVLAGAGITVLGTTVVPDGREGVSRAIIDACRDADVVITNGGTGMHPKDTTPEATRDVIDREVPGLAEAITPQGGLRLTPALWADRGGMDGFFIARFEKRS